MTPATRTASNELSFSSVSARQTLSSAVDCFRLKGLPCSEVGSATEGSVRACCRWRGVKGRLHASKANRCSSAVSGSTGPSSATFKGAAVAVCFVTVRHVWVGPLCPGFDPHGVLLRACTFIDLRTIGS